MLPVQSIVATSTFCGVLNSLIKFMQIPCWTMFVPRMFETFVLTPMNHERSLVAKRQGLLWNPYFSGMFLHCFFRIFFCVFFSPTAFAFCFCFCFCFLLLLLLLLLLFAFGLCFCICFCFCFFFLLFLLLLLFASAFAFASAVASADYLLCIDTATKLDDKTFTLSFDTQLHQSRNEAAQRCLYLICIAGEALRPPPHPLPLF